MSEGSGTPLEDLRARLAAGERLTAALRADLVAAITASDPGATEDVLAPLGGVNRVHLYESLVAWASLVPGERVLDLGTGAGGAARAAAREVGPQGLVIGIDMVPQAIELARRRTPVDLGVVYRLGRAERLADIPDRSIDCVVASLLLDDVPDVAPVLREAARVLRAGGRMVASVTAFDRLRPSDAPLMGAIIAVVARHAPGSLAGRGSRASFPHEPGDLDAFAGAGLHLPEERDVSLSAPLADAAAAWALFGRMQLAHMLTEAGREDMRRALAAHVPTSVHLPLRFLRTRRPG